MKGQRRENLPVVQTCLERGWTPGTVLTSGKWKESRVIREIGAVFAIVGKNRIRSLPPDVKEAEHALDHHP